LELHKNFTRDASVDKEEMIKFWKLCSSEAASGNFLKDSSILPDRAFSTVWLISKKLIKFSGKFYHRCISGQERPFDKIWKVYSMDPEFEPGSVLPWQKSVCSLNALVMHLYMYFMLFL